MEIKKLILLTSFIFGAIFLVNVQGASASNIINTADNVTNESLPEGVEIYYPKNPENLVEGDNPIVLNNNQLNDYFTPFAIGEQLPRQVFLYDTDKTATTTRIQLYKTESLGVYAKAKQFGKKGTMVATIFRDGVYYQSYAIYSTNALMTQIGPVSNDSQWSMRFYCGNPDELETGCKAEGTISVNL